MRKRVSSTAISVSPHRRVTSRAAAASPWRRRASAPACSSRAEAGARSRTDRPIASSARSPYSRSAAGLNDTMRPSSRVHVMIAIGEAHTLTTSSRSATRAGSDTWRTTTTNIPSSARPSRTSAGASPPPRERITTRSGVSGCGSWRPARKSSNSPRLAPGTMSATERPRSASAS
jgi:hypothetical protein